MFEKIDEYIFEINEKVFRITSDSIELVDFILEDDIEKRKILEIGPGTGYISTKLYKYSKDITSIEIQKYVYDQFEKNLIKNNIKIKNIFGDFLLHSGKYDLIISNPPYYPKNSGKYPENEIIKISKFEIDLTLDALLLKSYKLLEDNGSMYLVYPITRKKEILNKLSKYGFEIVRDLEKNKVYLFKVKKIKKFL